MDEIVTKAMIIGVSIFVTLIIVTVLIFEFTEIRRLYKISAETDVTFEDRLDEFNKYRDSTNKFNGIDVKNTIAKYINDKTVEVCIQQEELVCDDNINITNDDYTRKFSSTLNAEGNIYRIIFSET